MELDLQAELVNRLWDLAVHHPEFGYAHTDKRPRCYLSGPMTGIPFFNFHAFEVCAHTLREAGWDVYSPRENDAEKGIEPNPEGKLTDDGPAYKDLMKLDLWQVCDSDAVIVMPGWEWSEGARLEVEVAHRVGVPVFTYLSQSVIPVEERAPHEFSSRHKILVTQDEEFDLDAWKVPGKMIPVDKVPPFEIIDCGPKTRFKDPVTGGEKEESQARFDLIPPDAQTEHARVYGYGEGKYPSGPDGPNYLRGYPWHLSIASLERHVAKFKAGEDIDPESGLHHLAHAAWHAYTLVVFQRRNLGTDDRVKIQAA